MNESEICLQYKQHRPWSDGPDFCKPGHCGIQVNPSGVMFFDGCAKMGSIYKGFGFKVAHYGRNSAPDEETADISRISATQFRISNIPGSVLPQGTTVLMCGVPDGCEWATF